MKSGGQIVEQMSCQSPVVWWYREVNCEVVRMCVEAVPVLCAESVDFILNCEIRCGHSCISCIPSVSIHFETI
jgi:hypothetical protein